MKVKSRPKDDSSDDENDDEKNSDQKTMDEPVSKNDGTEKSVFLWLQANDLHYTGCQGQQSYSYATPNDIILGYNYLNMDKDWFSWLLALNNLSPTQFIWIKRDKNPHFKHLMSDDYTLKQISSAIQQKLRLDPQCEIRLKPFDNICKETDIVMNKIKSYGNSPNNITTYVADAEWAAKFANKSCLHRFISNLQQPSIFEIHDVYDINGLTECKGYICMNKNELLMAFDKLTKELGHNKVCIKDCFGASGDDISFYESKQEIADKFEWREEFKYIAVEEDLRYNESEIDKIEFVGISFYDNEVIGGGHEQIILDEAVFGGSKTYTNKKMEEVLKNVATKVMRKIGTKFMGGFDFAVQTFKDKNVKPKIYLIDMNTARYTATTQTFIVMKKFGIKNRYFIRKTLEIKQDACFDKVIDLNPDILYDTKSKTGVYFHTFHPDAKTAIVSIFGVDEKDANERLKELKNIDYLC